jgi:hypothetical protein
VRWTQAEGRLFRAGGRWHLAWRGTSRPVERVLDAWWEAGEWWEEEDPAVPPERQVLRLSLSGGGVVEVSAPLDGDRRRLLTAPAPWPGPVRLEAWLD